MNSQRQKTYFDNLAMFNLVKGFLLKIAHLSRVELVEVVMEKLIQELRGHNEARAANWLERHWTGERGRFSLGHAGYGCPNQNNGQESGWGRMKKKIPSDCAYYVFISAWQQHTAGGCKDEQIRTASIGGSDFPFLPSQPVFSRELWSAVRKLTLLDVRKWNALADNEQWMDSLDCIEKFIETIEPCSLARADVELYKRSSAL